LNRGRHMELKPKKNKDKSLLEQVYIRYYMVLVLGMLAMFASVDGGFCHKV